MTTPLASSFAYMPFGGVSSLTYGNGLTETNTYDDAYRLTARSVGASILADTYAYDDRNNVETKNTTTYGYDALDRLIQDGAVSISVDEVGNRTSMGGVSYTYGSGTSRLTGITQGGSTTTLSYYGGYQTGDGVKTYVWDGAGRLRTISDASGTLATYTYDAQHHRTKKVAGSTTTHYVYGAGGVLYGEYTSTGALVREYVYLHGRPLAQVDAGTPETITYLHTDHLGTPRAGSNSSGASVWSWSAANNAFGATAPTGTKTVNLRFAGQYFDAESGLFYNWNRYYNPATGRYISSDPIGLGGGLNTYAYAAANPVMYVDPEGLTQQQIDDMAQLARSIEGDLYIPKIHIANLGYGGGGKRVGLMMGLIFVDSVYLGQLSCDSSPYNLYQLYETIVHESLHYRAIFGTQAGDIQYLDHDLVYREAHSRMEIAKPEIEDFFMCQCSL